MKVYGKLLALSVCYPAATAFVVQPPAKAKSSALFASVEESGKAVRSVRRYGTVSCLAYQGFVDCFSKIFSFFPYDRLPSDKDKDEAFPPPSPPEVSLPKPNKC